MTMGKLYKRFVELVTRWKVNYRPDEFFSARLRLTFYYSLTAIVILGGSSVVLYNTILSNLTASIEANVFLDPHISQLIIDRAQDILINRFMTIDLILVFFVIVLGFLVTHKTLAPIKLNMLKQKRFIADASHELRTPIAVIISGLEVNLENRNLNFESAKRTLENTLVEMQDFSKLSNNLLDLSKYDMPTKTKYESIDISELISHIVEKNKSLAGFKYITIEAKIRPRTIVLGNNIELSRVFYNILDNAIKYTPHGGKISIFDKISLNKYVLTISDSGAGIPKEIIAKIFDPFFRGDVSRSTEGAGLGLTLARKIIENHKGTISIKSEEKKGTSVIISVPCTS